MKKLLTYALPLLMIMLFAACSSDGPNTPTPGPNEKTRMENATFTFSVNLPAQANPSSKNNSDNNSISTYAKSAQDENEVTEINVLAFLDTAGTFTLADKAEATNIEDITSGTDGNKKKFKVKFSKLIKNSQYQFVVIANAKSEVAQLFAQHGIVDGAEKTATLALLTLEGVEKWVDATGASIRNLPMWGESNSETVSENMDINNVRLLRMVAKINVTIDALSGVRNDFKLEQVDLYNFNKDARVIPDVANLASGSKSKVVNPTNIGIHTQGPITYLSSSYEALTETIYTFESKVPYLVAPAVDLGDVICLVIGGKYKNSATTRYYRADIAKKNLSDGYDYMDILRNHNYKVNVTKIANNGYDTSWEAFNSRAVNIDVEIEAWDEDDVIIDYDGQYQFGTDKRHLDFFMEGRAQDILVFADHPTGWSVDMATKPDWITIIPASDNSGAPKLMSVSADPILATDPDRTAEFYIVAGNLRKKITVKQTSLAEFSLEVNPTDITFRKSAASAKSFTVKSFPAGLTHNITYPTGGTSIVWETGYEPPATGSLSSYTIKPTPITIGGERATTITVSVTHPTSGVVISKTVSVTQYASDIEFVVVKPASYPAEGGNVNFTVRSAAMWQLNTTSLFVSNYSTAPQPISLTSVPYPFTLEGNRTYANRTITFEATAGDNETPDFPIQNVDIVQLHKPLYLNLGANLVNFGVTNVAQSSTVTTNAGWIVSSVSNTDVLLAASPTAPAVGQVQMGSTSALVETVGERVTLTPRVDYVGFGAMGTELTSVVRIESRNHTGATMIAREITVKRNVPSVFSVASITPATVAIGGGNVTANTVASNATWSLSSDLAGTTPYVHYAAEYNTINKAIAIPANTTWTNPRTFTVYVTPPSWHTASSIVVSQPGYSFAYSSGFPTGGIPIGGGTYSVIFKSPTASPIVYVRTVVSGIGIVSAAQSVPAIATANGTQAASMAIPTAWAGNRTVELQWSTDNANWATFSPNITAYQAGYTLPAAADYTILPALTANISEMAQTYTLKATSSGQFPAINVRILVNGGEHIYGVLPAGNLTSTTTIGLGANVTSYARTVAVQYQNPQTGTWANFPGGTGSQDPPLGIYIGSNGTQDEYIAWPHTEVVTDQYTASNYCRGLVPRPHYGRIPSSDHWKRISYYYPEAKNSFPISAGAYKDLYWGPFADYGGPNERYMYYRDAQDRMTWNKVDTGETGTYKLRCVIIKNYY